MDTPAAELPVTAIGQRRPESLPPFAPADRRWARPARSPSGVPDVAAVSAARAAQRAALKPYRKFSHGVGPRQVGPRQRQASGVLSRLMLYMGSV